MTDVVKDAIVALNAATVIKESICKLTDDTDALLDTLEGETDLDVIVRALLISLEEDQARIDGLTARIADLAERKARFELRIGTKRTLVHQALELLGRRTMELDIATVSLAKAAPALQVVQEADIPARFWKVGDPKLDRTAVLDALKAGEAVPGAALKNGQPRLTIRRK